MLCVHLPTALLECFSATAPRETYLPSSSCAPLAPSAGIAPAGICARTPLGKQRKAEREINPDISSHSHLNSRPSKPTVLKRTHVSDTLSNNSFRASHQSSPCLLPAGSRFPVQHQPHPASLCTQVLLRSLGCELDLAASG